MTDTAIPSSEILKLIRGQTRLETKIDTFLGAQNAMKSEIDAIKADDAEIKSQRRATAATVAAFSNGWTTANRGQQVIVPHARVALESIPRMQGQPPRFAVSTGTITQPSYTPRASGRKALFHHTYGALPSRSTSMARYSFGICSLMPTATLRISTSR